MASVEAALKSWAKKVQPAAKQEEAASVTRDTAAAVKQCFQENGPKVRRLLVARPSCGISAQAVSSGAHANALAENLAGKLKQDRDSSPAARRERIHLSISAPNAFTFNFGRQVAMMKPLTLYEYDFTDQVDGCYRPSGSSFALA